MLVKVDFNKKSITIGKKGLRWLDGYIQNTEAFMMECSRVKSGLSKYFVVDSINYAELVSILFSQNDYYFPKAPGIISILNYIEVLDSIPKGSALELEIDDFYYETFRKCAESVGKKKGFKIKVISDSYSRGRLGFIYNSPSIVKSLLKARIFTRLILGALRRACRLHDERKAKVVFLSNIRFEGKLPEDNSFFGGVIKELNKKGISTKIIRYEELIQLSNLKRVISKFAMQESSYIGDYYTLGHFRRCNKDFKALKGRWDAVKEKPEFMRIFNYKGYDYYDIIKPKLELVFNALSYIACDGKNIAKSIINKEGYSAIVLDHEENLYGKCFMLNTRLDKGKKSIALSHEIIWPGCIHTHVKSQELLDRNSLLWRPLPDVKCVWSDYARKVLVESCNYPDSIIRVTGNQKFDSLLQGKPDNKQAKNTLEKYGLSRKNKRVLCALWPFYELSNIGYIDKIDQASRKTNGAEFIIKPHPMDINVERIKQKLISLGNPCLRYANNKDDIYPLLYASDCVLTDGSTVGFEGVLLDKVVLGYQPPGIIVAPFLRGNVQIDDLDKVGEMIKRLGNSQWLSEVMEKNRMIKERYHYMNDGKASERVALEIEKLMKHKG